jgi:hypothetical protein
MVFNILLHVNIKVKVLNPFSNPFQRPYRGGLDPADAYRKHTEVTKQFDWKSRFFLLFLLDDRGIRIRSRIRIRISDKQIRIRFLEAQKHTSSIIHTAFLAPSINHTVLSCVRTDLKGECLETQQQNQSFLFSQEGGGGDAQLDMGKAFFLKKLCHEMNFLCWHAWID